MFLRSRGMPAYKSQSAMEYLMTYGWSILIVAVVLGALAYLGVFNPLYFAPKANPGSCQVFRPNGAGTSYDINLLGVCNGEIPEYAAQFNGNGGEQIYTATLPQLNQMTIVSWIEVGGIIPPSGAGLGPNSCQLYIPPGANPPTIDFDPCSCGNLNSCSSNSAFQLPVGKWIMIAYTISGDTVNGYSYGSGSPTVVTSTLPASIYIPSKQFFIGSYCGCSQYEYMDGYMADVQLYNTSLGQNSITALYQEGIGGAPIDLQNLVGWWPLNGNANDYSGNGYNGNINGNVLFTGSWLGSYTPP